MNQAQLMKSVLDLMRTKPEFRAKVRRDTEQLESPMLAAVDENEPIGTVVDMSHTHERQIYFFVLKNSRVIAGFTMAATQAGPESEGEAPMPVDPKAPVGMLLDAAKQFKSLNISVVAHSIGDSEEHSSSRLVVC